MIEFNVYKVCPSIKSNFNFLNGLLIFNKPISSNFQTCNFNFGQLEYESFYYKSWRLAFIDVVESWINF